MSKVQRGFDIISHAKKKKGYKDWNKMYRELEKMKGIVRFHFYEADYKKKEVLTFTSYEEGINTLIEGIKAKYDDSI